MGRFLRLNLEHSFFFYHAEEKTFDSFKNERS